MKKVLALMLALVLGLSLAACGGGSSSSENTTENTTKAEITADSLVGEWLRADGNFDEDISSINAINLMKGSIAKIECNKKPPFDWKKPFFNGTWEIKDDCVFITYLYTEGRYDNVAFEIIDEKTIKQVDNEDLFNKQ